MSEYLDPLDICFTTFTCSVDSYSIEVSWISGIYDKILNVYCVSSGWLEKMQSRLHICKILLFELVKFCKCYTSNKHLFYIYTFI